jgi:hypothetical protein
MSTTGRILGWILPGILCCGGCATPALVESSEATANRVQPGDTLPGDAATRATSPLEPGLRDAATIDEAARKSGIPEEQATRLAEIFLDAYAEMNRQTAQAPAGQAPLSRAVDGIPMPAATSAVSSPSPASLAAPNPRPGDDPQVSWERQVRSAIEQLRNDLDSETMDEERRARCQVRLSLLHLTIEDPEKAVEAIADLDDQQLEFWRQAVLGIGVLLDPNELPKFRYRAESAAEHFSRSVASLSSLGPLRLLNMSLCTKVDGFGDFVECNAYGLEPGKPVLLYVEVENFTAEPIQADQAQEKWASHVSRRGTPSSVGPPRYVTELHGRYEILDANQRTVVSRTLPVGGDTCRNHRRDYYISYVLYMPENIEPGAYTLELTIEDKKGGKFGNAVVDFRINVI